MSCAPLFAVLCFPMLWQKCHLYTIHLYQVHWIPRVHNRHKGLEIWFLQELNVNNGLVYQSQ